MSDYCSCIICRREFPNKGLHTHFSRVHGTDIEKSKYSSGYNGKYHILAARIEVSKCIAETEYNKSPVYCTCCNNILPYISRNSKFCNHSCSATYTNRLRIKITGPLAAKPKKIRHKCICTICNKEFKSLNPNKDYCTTRCRSIRRKLILRNNRTALINYRHDCAFKFSLKDFPDEFDFSIVENNGWYKPKNKGNNLYGVSRDHRISVRYGFDNNIDPKILAHPANCDLILHSQNSSKNINNSITLHELMDKIVIWDSKYPPI